MKRKIDKAIEGYWWKWKNIKSQYYSVSFIQYVAEENCGFPLVMLLKGTLLMIYGSILIISIHSYW